MSNLARAASCLFALYLSSFVAPDAAAAPMPQTPASEDDIDIYTLPAITGSITVEQLGQLEPFKNAATNKIQLRLIYTDGTLVKVGKPNDTDGSGVPLKNYVVDRYAPGFLKETTGTTGAGSVFDGEDLKKLIRTATVDGVPLKDKGGAVGVIVKKPPSTPDPPKDSKSDYYYYAIGGVLVGAALGFALARYFGRDGGGAGTRAPASTH